MREKRKYGQLMGPAISDHSGTVLTSADVNEMLWELLDGLYQQEPSLFPPTITGADKIREFYQCFRTFRKTSDTRAMDTNVSAIDIDLINRWEKIEKAGGKRAKQPMKIHYADFEHLLGPFKRYTAAM